MGLGGWLKDRASDAAHATSSVVDSGLDAVDHVGDLAEDAVHSGLAYAGTGFNDLTDLAASGLDKVGAHGLADDVDHFGDSVADALGGDVPEKQLGESDDPKDIIHGDVDKISSSATHLATLAAGFGQAASGLKGISTADWTGSASDAFHAVYDQHPKQWTQASDAFLAASGALDGYAHTVTWAQNQARDAIAEYAKGIAASKKAAADYNASVDTYNSAVDDYNDKASAGDDPGTKPTAPGPFVDPGTAMIESAQSTVKTARAQRDAAAEDAQKALTDATSSAPKEPSFHERMLNDVTDVAGLYEYENVHLTMGALKGVGDIVRFARTLDATDPYNITHPAEYLTGLDNTAAGLVHGVTHPVDLVKSLFGSGWSSDPAEALGKLIPQVALAVGTDGAGTAATATERGVMAADDLAMNAGERSALGLAEKPGALDDLGRLDDTKVLAGDPVDVATGTVVLDQVDLDLPGVLPIVVRRRHLSTWRHGRRFGESWASTFDERLDLDDERIVMVLADGIVADYAVPLDDEPVLPAHGPRWPLQRTEVGGYRVTDTSTGQVRHYVARHVRDDGTVTMPLGALTDPTGHRVMYAHDDLGRPVEVRHSGGYRVLVQVEGAHVTSLSVVQDGHDPVQVAAYRYTDDRLTEVTNASGDPLTFRYDERGRLAEWLDRNATSYTYAYDELDRCVAQGGTDGVLAATYEYADEPDGSGSTVMTDALGHRHSYLRDARHRVVGQVDPLGHVTRFAWDGDGRLTSVVDALGHETTRAYDADGHLASLTLPTGATQQLEHVVAGGRPQVSTLRGPDGAQWRFTYDTAGNRISVTDPAGAVTRYRYDEHGHLAAVVDPLGHEQRIETDGVGLPVAVTNAAGGVTTMERDGFGRVVALTDPVGDTVRLSWDAQGHPTSRTLADGSVETYRYDAEGNLVEQVDAAGRVTRLEHTHFDRVAREVAPDGSATTYDWDANLRLVGVTNPLGLTWRYEHDAAGRLVSETDFDGSTVHYEHDALGRVVRRTNGAGQVAEYAYDAAGSLVAKTVDGVTTTLAVDAAGRLLGAHGGDVELVLQRDVRGLVTSERIDARTLTTERDLLGRPVRRSTPSGVESAWTYDVLGLPATLDVAGRTTRFERDLAGREVRRHLAGGTVVDQVWEPGGLLSSQTVAALGGRPTSSSRLASRLGGSGAPSDAAPTLPLQQRLYDYAPGGALVGVDDQRGGSRRLELDLVGRVLDVVGSASTLESYRYDVLGNVVSADGAARDVAGTRLLATDRARYRYDGQGRLVGKTVRRLDRKDDVWSYTWDAEDRMTGLVTPDGTTWRYRYDVLGRRTSKERLAGDGSVAERVDFTWDGSTLVEQTTSTGSTTWTHDGLVPLAQVETGDAVDARFFSIVSDVVGAPSELVDDAGRLAWSARRSIWGASAGDVVDATPLRFPGQYADDESGLFYNVHRYYDPETARYTSPDPLGLAPAPNPATFVANPTTTADPLGLAPCVPDVSGQATPRPLIMGENMERVRAYADAVGGHAYRPWANDPFDFDLGMRRNARMITDRMREGRDIIDIGPDFARRALGRDPSPFYNMERTLTDGYPGYSKVFERHGKLEGGVPGLDY